MAATKQPRPMPPMVFKRYSDALREASAYQLTTDQTAKLSRFTVPAAATPAPVTTPSTPATP